MSKITRYAIHRSIIALILLIPVIFSIDTGYKTFITKELPDKNYEVIAEGVITHKYSTLNKFYFTVNDQDILVERTVYKNNEVGDDVVLTIDKGASGYTVFRYFIGLIVAMAAACGLIGLCIFLLEQYFKWLKGDDE